MSIIYMLLSISVIVAIFFFAAFVISVRKGQYDDTFTPSVRMLFEDELVDEAAPVSAEKQEDKSTNSNSKH
ncbi:MAG: cbb3-type cytochrome oxidase assembly protein CcoS [Bacteroidota bacterium]